MKEPIAITGLSCRFAGARSPRAFWKAILHKRSQFTPFATSEEVYRGAGGGAGLFPGRVLPQYGAFLGALYGCSADVVSLPTDLGAGDNSDFYFISQLIHEALADAAWDAQGRGGDRISLFLGYESFLNSAGVNWLQHAAGVEQIMAVLQQVHPGVSLDALERLRGELTQALPLIKARQIELTQTGNIATRLAQSFRMSDTVMGCQAGEASVFVGLEAAVDALRDNRCDVAVVGAVQPPLSETFLMGEAGVTSFTDGGALRPFTSDTNGTLPGEGGAFFVLRRQKDVLASGAPMYALVHGTGMVASVAESEPPVELLRRAMHRGMRRLPNGFRDIDYWEMNGSGIPEEDAVEVELLERMTANRGAHIPLLALGAVKTIFGHTLAASGAASLLKGVLALSHQVLPPSVTPQDDSFTLSMSEAAYYWVRDARPWIAASTRPRRCVTSTYSAAMGRAACAVLEACNREDA